MELFGHTYLISSGIFLRGLGLIFFVAFFSLSQQVKGLYCSDGISPISDLLDHIKKVLGKKGFFRAPSIFWINSGDLFLIYSTYLGMGCSILLVLGIMPPLMIFLLWALYLSFVSLGQDFLSFQWDVLLLEVASMSFFLSLGPSSLGILCFQFFIFRFIFSSGHCKIMADKNWRNLSSMKYHFETQPLPNPLSWYFHQATKPIYKLVTLGVLILELVVPFLFFGPPNLKLLGFSLSFFLQVLIILSGNFCFFNLLTILLLLFLINDSYYPFEAAATAGSSYLALELIFSLFLLFNIIRFLGLFFRKFESIRFLGPFCLFNSYGLFARMTTKRYEINLEGSLDGKSWIGIPFKYKIEDPKVGGVIIAPLQPRLDWQMWFLALDPINLSPWFNDFLDKLFKNSQGVISLLGKYPFKSHPPKIIRVSICLYRFATIDEKKETGNFWIKEDHSSFLINP